MKCFCVLLACSVIFSFVLGDKPQPCSSEAADGILEKGCWGYHKCFNNETIIYLCQGTQVLHVATMVCVNKSDADSVCGKEDKACVGLADGMYADEADQCNSYWRCYGGVSTKQLCPATLAFNQEIQVCDYRNNILPPCGTKIIETSTTSATSAPKPSVIVGRKKRNSQEEKKLRRERLQKKLYRKKQEKTKLKKPSRA